MNKINVLSAVLMMSASTAALAAKDAKPAAASTSWKILAKNSSASFRSEATLETIVGNTTNVESSITFDPLKPAETKGRVDVDVASLKTGIDMRDEHLRSDKWLDSQKFPKLQFEIVSVAVDGKLEDGKPTKAKVKGKFTAHGVTVEKEAEGTVTLFKINDKIRNEQMGLTNDLLKVDLHFPVKFTDHGMAVPQMLFYKVANEFTASVGLTYMKE